MIENKKKYISINSNLIILFSKKMKMQGNERK